MKSTGGHYRKRLINEVSQAHLVIPEFANICLFVFL